MPHIRTTNTRVRWRFRDLPSGPPVYRRWLGYLSLYPFPTPRGLFAHRTRRHFQPFITRPVPPEEKKERLLHKFEFYFLFSLSYPLRELSCIKPTIDCHLQKKSDFSFANSNVHQHFSLTQKRSDCKEGKKICASKCSRWEEQ